MIPIEISTPHGSFVLDVTVTPTIAPPRADILAGLEKAQTEGVYVALHHGILATGASLAEAQQKAKQVSEYVICSMFCMPGAAGAYFISYHPIDLRITMQRFDRLDVSVSFDGKPFGSIYEQVFKAICDQSLE